MELAFSRLTELLGGRSVFIKLPKSENDFAQYIRAGLPWRAYDTLTAHFRLSNEELVAPLGLSIPTIKRRKPEKRMSVVASDRLFRIATVLTRAVETLGSEEKASRWLRKPNRTLSGDTPLSQLDTTIGYEKVLETLLRIEYGIYS